MKNPCKKMNNLFLITLLSYLSAVIILSLLAKRSMGVSLTATLVIGELAVVIPGIVFLLLFHCDIGEWIPIRRVGGSTIAFTFLLTFLIQPLLYFLNALSQLFEKNVTLDLLQKTEDVPWFVLLSVIGVIGPVCEEVIFRGILFSGYRRSGRIIASVLWTAFLFGLFHMNLNQFGYAMMIGIVSAFLVEGTGSLVPSLIMHIVINSLNVLQMFAVQKLSAILGHETSELFDQAAETAGSSDLLIVAGALLIPAAVGTVLAAVVYIAILKREGTLAHMRSVMPFKKQKDAESEEVRTPILSVTGVIGVLICVIMIFGIEKIMQLIGSM